MFIRKRVEDRVGFVILLDSRGDFVMYEISRIGNKRVRITWRLLDDSPSFSVSDQLVKRYREKKANGKLYKLGDSVW